MTPGAEDSARPDLAAMLVPLGRELMALERPILDEHGLSMWAYSVLSRLDDEPLRTQAALAAAIHADKTRIIPVLDDLEHRGLLTRSPDPADRRARLLALTPEGRRLRDTVRTAVRGAEIRFLERVPAGDRTAFVRGLLALHEAGRTPG
ncbi:MarR family winged helix-turn-helix transcriptional regulator [Pseudonocardia sp. HH130630-07]|uniref:MarR family winged helix-turn-helix transcriptional regulator n=1 Tax=Pseudonocardia sp. HH130630-07 TaxID=1690815 RepID=UPI00081524C8|nr:MarR family winged helix-turn-helix transcriptional regulator [Pseudonocardia sp. HH130630-07]ANY07716.1 MarR family transcriptional regulator [Pseudonocardia sp. HH130630-07]